MNFATKNKIKKYVTRSVVLLVVSFVCMILVSHRTKNNTAHALDCSVVMQGISTGLKLGGYLTPIDQPFKAGDNYLKECRNQAIRENDPAYQSQDVNLGVKQGLKETVAKVEAEGNKHGSIFGINVNVTDWNSLILLLQAIPPILMWVVGVISVIFVIVGGIMYVTSAGSPDAAKRAKSTIVMALAGLVVAISSLAIYNLVVRAIVG